MPIQREQDTTVPLGVWEDVQVRRADNGVASAFLREFLGGRPFPASFDVLTRGESPWNELFGLLHDLSVPVPSPRRGRSERVFVDPDAPDMEFLVFAPKDDVITAHLLLAPVGDMPGNHARFEFDGESLSWELVDSDLPYVNGVALKENYLKEGTPATTHTHYAAAM